MREQIVDFQRGAEVTPRPAAAGRILNPKTSPKPWPDPKPLGGELPPVALFNPALLPESLRAWVTDISERLQTPPDFAAAAAVAALAGSVNRRAIIRPKAHDSSWVVVPNLWGAMIGPPGVMKSPAASAVMRPLERIESGNRSAFEVECRRYEAAKELYDVEVSAWKEAVKRAVKNKKEMPCRPEFAQTEPVPRRLITNDATFEALHELLAGNPAGLLVHRDELTGWLAGLERQGREGERAFFLEAWNGDKPFTQDRIGRGSVHVPANCLSLFGGIQPGRLRSYLADALKDGPANDGLIQRFQVTVWPDIPREWKLIDRLSDSKAEASATGVFERLTSLETEPTLVLRYAPDAQELFDAWFTRNQTRVRAGEFHPAMAAHVAKYPKSMPALSVLFELADWAATASSEITTVSLDHARQAAAFCDDYLESHAARMYSCITAPQVRAARELADRLKRAKLPATFSLRDVYLKGWSGLGTPGEARAALEILTDSHWVRELPSEPHASGGRPSERYQTNPKVLRGQVA
jgi:putative DNA primase/helicase